MCRLFLNVQLKVKTLTIGLVQSAVGMDIDENLEKTSQLVHLAADSGAQIICLQELFATQYFAQVESSENFQLAEQIPGKITNFLQSLAQEAHVGLIGGSLFELGEDEHYYNTSLIFDAQGILLGKYRKMHIPYDPRYYEKFYFSPGNLGYIQVPLDGMMISPLICYDQWFPEPARVNALHGAQMIFYPTAIGWFPDLAEAEPSLPIDGKSHVCTCIHEWNLCSGSQSGRGRKMN